jgi:hypothetical protein
MANKIKSFAVAKRKTGRPFNTTRYPWRSLAIGRSFFLRPGKKVSGSMLQKLREEGFFFSVVESARGYRVYRVD